MQLMKQFLGEIDFILETIFLNFLISDKIRLEEFKLEKLWVIKIIKVIKNNGKGADGVIINDR